MFPTAYLRSTGEPVAAAHRYYLYGGVMPVADVTLARPHGDLDCRVALHEIEVAA